MTDPTATMPFGEAALCLDCSTLFNIRALRCPRCASVYMQLVATWVPVDVREGP